MKGRVLVVDDESGQRRLYRRILESFGFSVSEAASAREALSAVSDPAARPDLVLCDISMPGTDGAALAKALRSAAETSDLPVILMTGLAIPRGVLDAASERLGGAPVFLKGGDARALAESVADALRAAAPAKPRIVVDHLRREVWIAGRRLPRLPPRRFQLFCALLREPRVMRREELLQAVWEGGENINIVDVTLLRLRRDLRGSDFLRIETAPSGYRLVIGEPA